MSVMPAAHLYDSGSLYHESISTVTASLSKLECEASILSAVKQFVPVQPVRKSGCCAGGG